MSFNLNRSFIIITLDDLAQISLESQSVCLMNIFSTHIFIDIISFIFFLFLMFWWLLNFWEIYTWNHTWKPKESYSHRFLAHCLIGFSYLIFDKNVFSYLLNIPVPRAFFQVRFKTLRLLISMAFFGNDLRTSVDNNLFAFCPITNANPVWCFANPAENGIA